MASLCAAPTSLTASRFAAEFSPRTFQDMIAQLMLFIGILEVSPETNFTNEVEVHLRYILGMPMATNRPQLPSTWRLANYPDTNHET